MMRLRLVAAIALLTGGEELRAIMQSISIKISTPSQNQKQSEDEVAPH
jgi:hypothetical protein